MTLPPGIVPTLDSTPPENPIPTLEDMAGQQEIGTFPEPDAPKPRRGRGRPKRTETGEPAASPGPEPSPEELGALADAFGMTFDYASKFMASRRGAHWLIAPEEREVLGQAWANALAPYMGTFAKYTPMLAAVVVTAGVLGPRVQQDAELAEEAAKRATGRKREDKDASSK